MNEQPPPVPNASAPIIDLVMDDLDEIAAIDREGTQLLRGSLLRRADLGLERYGVKLQARNGRDALQDAADEADDLVMYLRQCMAEGLPLLDEKYGSAIDLAIYLHRRIAARGPR